MSWENQTITKIVDSGSLSEVVKYGITVDDFLSSEGKAVFQYMLAYASSAQTYGSVLGRQAFATLFPHYILKDDPSMSIQAVCYELRKSRIDFELAKVVREAETARLSDPLQALTLLQSRTTDIRMLASTGQRDINLATAAVESRDRYLMRKSGYVTAVAMWPWPYVNIKTGGIQPDEYCIIYGRPKNKKSWILYAIAQALQEQNKRILVYTKESTAAQFADRMLCLTAKVDYERFRDGKLEPAEEYNLEYARYYIEASQLYNRVTLLDTSDSPEGADTVEWLNAKIEDHNPDITMVDGAYLMSSSKAVGARAKLHEKVSDISRSLRRVVLARKKPIIITVQANRAAGSNTQANSEEIAFSDSLGQDATMFFRVINEEAKSTVAVVVGACRESRLESFRVNAKCAQDFSFLEVIVDKDSIEGSGPSRGRKADKDQHALDVAKRLGGRR